MKGANVAKNVKTFTRILPSKTKQWEYVKVLEDGKTIYARCLQDFLKGNLSDVSNYWNFETDKVFFKECQEEIYSAVVSDIIDDIFNGRNAIIVAYGQTGTGKSLTISGLENFYKDRGFAPRLITDLINRKDQPDDDYKTLLFMSYVEIEKKYVHDLLRWKQNSLDVFSMKNVKIEQVKTEYEALKLLFLAEARKEIVDCSAYSSNRLSGVLTFHIVRKRKKETNPCIINSKLHLIDLAGCDNPDNLTCSLKSVVDVGTGNIAKTQLEHFILMLIEDISVHITIKRRSNLLISYLGDSLDSCNLLRFVGHIRTNKESLGITLSLLRFTQLMRNMKPKKYKGPEVCEEGSAEFKIKTQLEELIKDNTINAMITNGTLSTNLNQDRLQHIRNMVEAYLGNTTNETVVLNVADAKAVLTIFKEMYRKQQAMYEKSLRSAYEKIMSDIESAKGHSTLDSGSSNRAPKPPSRRSFNKSKESTRDSLFTDSDSRSFKKRKKSQESRGGSSRTTARGTVESLKSSRKSRVSGMIQSKKEKRHSSSLMSLSAIGLDEKLIKELFLPDSIPDPQMAWDSFANSDGYEFKELKEELVKVDTEAKKMHFMYLLETKQIEKCLELVELRREELDRASIQDKIFDKVDHSKNEEQSVTEEEHHKPLTDVEKVCLELLSQAEGELIQQQERALQKQAELKVLLDRLKQLKKNIRKQFQKFCRDTYSTFSPTLSVTEQESCQKNIEYDDIPEITETESVEEKPDPGKKIFEHLQCLMRKERERWQNAKKKTRKWTFTYKTQRGYFY